MGWSAISATATFIKEKDNKDKDKDNPGGELPDDPGGGTPPVGSPSAPPLDDPGGGDTTDDKDKDNPHTDDDPPLSTKVNLAAAPMIVLVPVISTLPTCWLLQIPKRRVSLLLFQ